MSKRWLDRRREDPHPKTVHGSRLDAAVALVAQRLATAGIGCGDGFLDVDLDGISWDVEDGAVFIRVPFRIGKLTRAEVEREFARRR